MEEEGEGNWKLQPISALSWGWWEIESATLLMETNNTPIGHANGPCMVPDGTTNKLNYRVYPNIILSNSVWVKKQTREHRGPKIGC
jgi:hypothetical protein